VLAWEPGRGGYPRRVLVGDREGLSVTDFVSRFSIIPLVALASRKPLLATRLEHYGRNPDVPRHVHHVAGPSGLSAPATPDGREGKAGVPWRFGGR
jgi:hypothetical protein